MIPEHYFERIQNLLTDLGRKLPGVVPDELHRSLQVAPDKLDAAMHQLVDRLALHYPFHQPFYAGQMLKPPHPAAWLAYALAMTINPNNHALDGGPEASRMEKEVIRKFMAMVGFPDDGLGHLTSSGTIANLEALWVARELHPDRPVGISSQSHYTHRRMCRVLRQPVVEIPDDAGGVPDPTLWDDNAPLPGTVVVTLGTTGFGRLEPLHRIMEWAKKKQVRIHVDAAYGGFFRLLRDTGLIDPEPWYALSEADSVVIDPHKHGLQPYGCGSVLFRDPAVGQFYKHDSPYTYFTSGDLHLGEISLECSRAGSAAVALWFTLQLLSLDPLTSTDIDSEKNNSVQESTGLAHALVACRQASLDLYEALKKSEYYQPVVRPELDIVTFLPETEEKTFSAVSCRSEEILKMGMEAEEDRRLYLSTFEIGREEANRHLSGLKADRDNLRVLRSVLMKPDHHAFIPGMIRRLESLHQST